MATYKVLQHVEAEDKLVGPLTLRQFIYAGIAAISGYLGFLMSTKGAAFMLVVFVPVSIVTGFFAFPWGRDQPTEIWALAKIRFLLKPRQRVWDQSGTKDLVTVTAPKMIEHLLTNGLNQDEVQSRLSALANTIDSRGWAVKNLNVNLTTAASLPSVDTTDRLVQASTLPQEVSSFDVRASDDMLDEYSNPVAQHVDTMLRASTAAHHQQLVTQMQQPQSPATDATSTSSTAPTPDYWFMHQPAPAPAGQATFLDTPIVTPGTDHMPSTVPQAAAPTPEEKALVEHFKRQNDSMAAAYGHMKTIKTPEQLAKEAKAAATTPPKPSKPPVTPEKQAAIINLANTDGQDVATLARRAHKEIDQEEDGTVVISLR